MIPVVSVGISVNCCIVGISVSLLCCISVCNSVCVGVVSVDLCVVL